VRRPKPEARVATSIVSDHHTRLKVVIDMGFSLRYMCCVFCEVTPVGNGVVIGMDGDGRQCCHSLE
jgi:hypothetical protein